MVTSSPTRMPPVSSTEFQVNPKSLRLIFVVAETAIRVLPHGSFALGVGPSMVKSTLRVTARIVRSPSAASSPSRTTLMRVDLKERVGNFSTSKKSALLRCASRWASRVSIEAASIEASTCDLVTSDSSSVSTPVTLGNCPFTFEIIICFTLNSATEWTGSRFQVVVVVDVCGIASVLMVFVLSLSFRCVMTIFVATYMFHKQSAYLGAGGLQQFGERLKPLSPHVAQLFAMGCLHRFIQAGQEPQTFLCNPCHHGSPVLGLAATRDQSPLLQSIEQASHIRVPSNHSVGD